MTYSSLVRNTLALSCTLLIASIPLSAVHAEETSAWWQRETSTKKFAEQTLSHTRVESVPIPILFGFDVTDVPDDFGVPRSGGRTHEGIDFMAPRRALIVSPTDAIVHSTGDGASSGLYVYTYNPGGEVFAYMHLDEIAPGLERGDVLRQGDLIGYVGNTGNASATAPHLHFEIRDTIALDAHDRVTATFSLHQKLHFLERILATLSPTDAEAVATSIAAYYGDDMRSAQASGLLIPSSIEAKLGRVTALDVPASASSLPLSSSNPSVGSEGTDVITLQTFLIHTNTGSAARALAAVGATGYFGSLTTAALAEYQTAVGLNQRAGIYDDQTRAYIAYISGGTIATVPKIIAPEPVSHNAQAAPSTSLSGMPSTDLTAGAKGSGVVWLQQFLITKNIGPKAAMLRTTTATGYFGPVTTAALAEYQAHVGISPAVGYYGELTRTAILTNR